MCSVPSHQFHKTDVSYMSNLHFALELLFSTPATQVTPSKGQRLLNVFSMGHGLNPKQLAYWVSYVTSRK